MSKRRTLIFPSNIISSRHRTTQPWEPSPLKRVTSLPNQFPIPLHQCLRVRDDLMRTKRPGCHRFLSLSPSLAHATLPDLFLASAAAGAVPDYASCRWLQLPRGSFDRGHNTGTGTRLTEFADLVHVFFTLDSTKFDDPRLIDYHLSWN
jgi:hypothetical protein